MGKTQETSIDEQLRWLQRGAEAIYTPEDLRRKLASGRPLRVKLGMDPTAPDIHLGHTVALRKMRHFQDLGHKAVLIIGDYTARIGDPTGQDTTRPVLGPEEIEANARTYLDQAGKVLDLSEEKFERRYNSEWLGGLSMADVLQITAHFTVGQMMARESFRKRSDAGREIHLTELLYPVMQAYDSVMIEADVELGGTDQTFNNLRGRDLMGRYGMEPQVVLVMPILAGLDGHEKMSKSKGNYVGVAEPAEEMFGKIMSVPDELMVDYFRLLTPLPEQRIVSLTDAQITHPREAKDALARMIVEGFYDGETANSASEAFKRRFREGQLPDEMETHTVAPAEQPIAGLLTAVGFAKSRSEARRLVAQGGVKFDGEKVTDAQAVVTVPAEPVVLQVGKRRVCRVVAGEG